MQDRPLQVEDKLVTQPKESKYLSIWVMVGFWCGISNDAAVVPDHCDEEGAEPEVEAFDFNQTLNLRFNPYLWLWSVGSDRKNEIIDTQSPNKFLP